LSAQAKTQLVNKEIDEDAGITKQQIQCQGHWCWPINNH